MRIVAAVFGLFALFGAASSAAPPSASAGQISGPNASSALQIAAGTLFDATVGASYSSTLWASGGTLPYTWSLVSGALPAGLSLNPSTGAVTGTPTSVGVSAFTVQAKDAAGVTATASSSITVASAPLKMDSSNFLPDGVVGTPYSQAVPFSGGVPPYTWTLTYGLLPEGLHLDPSTGLITGTPTTPVASQFFVNVKDSAGVSKGGSGYITITGGPVQIATTELPPTYVGANYFTQHIFLVGGTAPFTWRISAGALPDGIALDNGMLSGSARKSGTFSFTITVRDKAGSEASRPFSIVVGSKAVTVDTTALPPGEVGKPYLQTIAISGGVGPYKWAFGLIGLPNGLSFDNVTHTISGTPTKSGNSEISGFLLDATGTPVEVHLSLTIKPASALGITTATSFDFTVTTHRVVWQQTAAGGTGPYTWSLIGGALPPGLSMATSGEVSGTLTQAGTYSFTVQVKDAMGAMATRTFSLKVSALRELAVELTPPSGAVGVQYQFGFNQPTGRNPFTYAIISGSLPPGLEFLAFGYIRGTPTTIGTSTFTVQVTDASGATATGSVSITITATPELKILTGGQVSVNVGGTYGLPSFATGGIAPYTWSVASGTLPAGLALDAVSGTISGVPTTVGSSTVTVRVTDAAGATATTSYTLNVVGPTTLTIVSTTLGNATAGMRFSSALLAKGGTPPYHWSATGLPLGVGVADNGVAWGTPSGSGDFTLTVSVRDSSPEVATATQSVTLHVGSGSLSASVTAGANRATAGTSYSSTIATGVGGVPPYNYGIASGSLPPGLTMAPATGLVTGTPSAAGSYAFTWALQDAAGGSVTVPVTFVVTATPPRIDVPANLTATVGTGFARTLTASGGVAPYTWGVSSGLLPPWLSLNATTGVLSGTPAVAEAANILVLVTDGVGGKATAQVTITVNAAASRLTVTSTALPTAKAGAAYAATLEARGGTVPYRWSIASGTLPAGLTLDATGAINGTPATAGTSAFTLQVKDNAGATASSDVQLVVTDATLTRVGAFTQVAAGGGWTTSMYLANESAAAVKVAINFWSDAGQALALPLHVTQDGATTASTTSAFTATIAPGATVRVEGASDNAVLTGWGEVLSSAPIKGYGVFHYTSPTGAQSEGTVPLDPSGQSTLLLPFESSSAFATAIAVANVDGAQSGGVDVTAWSDAGQALATTTFALAANGHKALMLSDLIPTVNGQRGLVELKLTGAASLTGLGIRVNPSGGFASSVSLQPAVPDTAANGFSIALGAVPQIAVGGGWRTSLYLSNPSSSAIDVMVSFRSDAGTPLTVPMTISGANIMGAFAQYLSSPLLVSASTETLTIPANSTALIDCASDSGTRLTGTAQIYTNANTAANTRLTVSGVFHYTSPTGVASEGTVPMDAAYSNVVELPYEADNRFDMGVALSNLSASSAEITVSLVDEMGITRTGVPVTLVAGGHTSFMLTAQIPAAAGHRGLLRFTAPAGVPITGLGLRVNPTGGFASVPKL